MLVVLAEEGVVVGRRSAEASTAVGTESPAISASNASARNSPTS